MDVAQGTTSKLNGAPKPSGPKSSMNAKQAQQDATNHGGAQNYDLLSSIMATVGVQQFAPGFAEQVTAANMFMPNGASFPMDVAAAEHYAKLTAQMMAYQAAQGNTTQPSTSVKSGAPPPMYVPGLAAHAAKAAAKTKQLANPVKDAQQMARMKEELEVQLGLVEGDEEGGMIHGETYDQYKPSKLTLGLPHPDPIVETLSLGSVQPPDITYELDLPDNIANEGLLSSLQLEAIVYACQQHERFLEKPADGGAPPRAGFLIGDGAGVGKGRTIAGIIYENWLHGRKKSVWLSVSNDLKYDAIRDLEDIGADMIDVNLLSKAKYGYKLNSSENGNIKNGVMFVTYPSLVGESQSPRQEYGTRMKQLLKWCGTNFDGCLIFDECHRAKNLCPAGGTKPTKTGLAVLEIQRLLPKARVVYASATGASEPRNMAYMTRLGIWGPQTPFRDFFEFTSSIEKRGVSAMEIIAMDMKLRGSYIARQLSFAGVSFEIGEVPMENHYKELFNDCVDLWGYAREKFAAAAELFQADSRLKKHMWGQFWGAHQRFFKYLCLSAKVKATVKIAKEAVRNGKCAVIGLQSTGEARTLECLDENNGVLNDFVSTSRAVFQSLVDKHFPAFDRRKTLALAGLTETLEQEAEAALDEEPDEVDSVTGRAKRKVRKLVTSYKAPTLSDLEDSDASNDTEEPRPSTRSSPRRTVQKKKKKAQPKRGRPRKKQRREDSDVSPSSSEDSSFTISDSDSPSDSFSEDGVNSDDSEPANSSDSNVSEEEDSTGPNPWLKMLAAKEKAKKKRKKEKKEEMAEEDLTEKASDQPPGKSRTELREESRRMKEDLLNRFDELSSRLPPNTLDDLIDQLGGPAVVAEMTGRKGRVVSTDSGSVEYEARNENDVALELLNLAEKQRFMNGEKLIAIISEAASSGISLQADRRAVNQRRRVHITLELSWSADKAIQQFGRTHRSNQVSAPEYMFLITDLAGEKRFAAAVARRLECLGALTHGDRRATDSRDLSMFNIDTKYGRQAVERTCKYASGVTPGIPKSLLPPFKGGEKAFVQQCQRAMITVGMLVAELPGSTQYSLDKNAVTIGTFLNRILGMKVEMQNSIFEMFVRTMDSLVDIAKREGKFEMGIVELGFGSSDVSVDKKLTFTGNLPWTKAPTVLYAISVERGLSWENALEILNEHDDKNSGFYMSYHEMAGKHTICLAVRQSGQQVLTSSRSRQLYHVYRPNSGMQLRMDPLDEIQRKGRLVSLDEAVKCWKGMYDSMSRRCVHAYWAGNCKNTTAGMQCDIGLRRKTYMVLSGSILSVWHEVGRVLYNEHNNSSKRVQNVRVRLANDKRIVGIIVPNAAVEALVTNLKAGGWKMSEDAILSTSSRLSDDSDSDGSVDLTDED